MSPNTFHLWRRSKHVTSDAVAHEEERLRKIILGVSCPGFFLSFFARDFSILFPRT